MEVNSDSRCPNASIANCLGLSKSNRVEIERRDWRHLVVVGGRRSCVSLAFFFFLRVVLGQLDGRESYRPRALIPHRVSFLY